MAHLVQKHRLNAIRAILLINQPKNSYDLNDFRSFLADFSYALNAFRSFLAVFSYDLNCRNLLKGCIIALIPANTTFVIPNIVRNLIRLRGSLRACPLWMQGV